MSNRLISYTKKYLFNVNLFAVLGVSLLVLPQTAFAQEKPKCEKFKAANGNYGVKTDNLGWHVSLNKDLRGDVYLWFSKSLLSRKSYNNVESLFQLNKKFKEEEVLAEKINDKLKLTLNFDNGETISVISPLERRTSRGKPYYFYRWADSLDLPQHQEIFDFARASKSVFMSIEDAKTGKLLRRSTQLLEDLDGAIIMAEKELKRIDKAEPGGTCSRF